MVKGNILIVDDNVDFCTTIADIVQSFGHFTSIINDPDEALKYLDRANKNTDIVLLDIEFEPISKINGLDILEYCRHNYISYSVIKFT